MYNSIVKTTFFVPLIFFAVLLWQPVVAQPSELPPLIVSDIQLSVQPPANVDGTINEGSTATLTFEVSGGTDMYQYASKIDDAAEYTSFQPPFIYSIADDFIAADATTQTVTLTIRVSDQSAEIEDVEYTEELHIRKTNKGSADINLSITSATLTAIVGTDPDGDATTPNYTYQWQTNTGSEWMNVASTTDTSYTISGDLASAGVEFRVQVTYTDGQGYEETLISNAIRYIPPSELQPLMVSDIQLSVQPSANIDGTINEGSTATITFDVSGGTDMYQYEFTIDDDVSTSSTPLFIYSIADDFIAADATSQTVTLTIRVSDPSDEIEDFEHTEELHILKTNKGSADINLSITSATLTAIVGTDPDGDATTPNYTYQWQTNTGSEWMDIASTTDTSYTISGDLASASGEFRVQVMYIDGQGYTETPISNEVSYIPTSELQPLMVSDIQLSVQPPANVDGTINEGSTATLTFEVSGGTDMYQYEFTIDDDVSTSSTPLFIYSIADNFIAAESTSQIVTLTIRVSDQSAEIEDVEYTEELHIRKTNNGPANINISITNTTLTAIVGTDPDGDATTPNYTYQWQTNTGSEWMNVASTTDTSYTISDDLASASGEFRVQVMYTDGQGYSEMPISNEVSYTPPSELQPLMVSDIQLSVQPPANVDGTINEGSTATLTFEVSGGTDMYQYEFTIDDDVSTSSTPLFMYSIADDFIAADATSQIVRLTIRVSDQSAEIEDFEHTEELHIRKTNNGLADINLSITNITLTAIVGADPDGNPNPSTYTYQWQSRTLAAGSPWLDIDSAADKTYTITDDLASVSGEFRVQVMYTDGQGYLEAPISNAISYTAPSELPPLMVSDIQLSVQPPANTDGTINEGSNVSLMVNATSGSESYHYVWSQISGKALVLTTTNTATLNVTIAPDLVELDATTATLTFQVEVSDGSLTISRRAIITIKKINNGIPAIAVDVNAARLRVITTTADADGAGSFSYQWQQLVFGGTWTDITAATTATYWLPADVNARIQYRVEVTHTDSQGHTINYQQGPFRARFDDDNDGLIDIYTLEDLDDIRDQHLSMPSTCGSNGDIACDGFELRRSLDFSTVESYQSGMIDANWTTSTGWQPIGSDTNRFSGIFEGNGHTISNLYINRIAEASLGLFSVVDTDGEVNNVGLLNVSVEGSESNIGGVIGLNYGRITNSYATGAVTGTGDEVGGLVGDNDGRVMNSYATVAVTGNDDVGGLVGNNGGSVTNSYATGGVAGNSWVGGLVGWNLDGSVTNSYATGAVTGNDNVGGLVGSNEGDIMNSYAMGAVTGSSGVGGLVSYNGGSVTNSYATGAVTGNSNVGGLVGWSSKGSVTNSYWNTQTSGLATSAGGDGVTSATTVQLQSPTAPGTTPTEVYYGWSSDDWDFGTSSQYPILKKSDGTLLSPTLRYGLSQLRLAQGHLSPDFISIIPNYTGSVVVDTNTIQLIPIAINANARIHITGRGTQEIASGTTSDDIILNEDGITTITIVVVTAGISIEYNFNLRHHQYSGDDVDIDDDGLIEIDTIEDLNAIRYQPDGTGYRKGTVPKITTGCPSTGCKGYELTKNLSFAEDSDWSPIAFFSGIFEGNGYTISKLTINKPNANSVGFFSSITSGAEINNIGLLDIDIQGDEGVGGLVGENYGRITNSYANGAVTGTSDEVGGLVGSNEGDIMNSYATGAVTGNNGIGGLVGNNGGSVTNSYATEAVTGNSRIGGLVGINYFGSVTNSYATGAVTGNGNVGGLVGENDGRITNSYATGVVTGNHNAGGLVGENVFSGSVTNSYWNTQTSGLATSAGGDGVTSATTVQLQSPTAPGTTPTEVYYGWSSDDWDFGTSSQYPILKKSDGTLLSPTLRYGLSQLRLANGHLSPGFISVIPNYTGLVVVDTNTIQLIPVAINANARIHITSRGTQEIASGDTSDDIMLNEEGITTITIVVMTAGISIEYNFNLRHYQYSGDIDIDDDGLIEIDTIEDLNAIRYQPDGTGYKEGTAPKITAGCPSTGCKGYELTKNLSFAEDSDWSPIAVFSGIFEGNGYTISKLTINKPNADSVGFFSSITSGAKINNIGLLDIDIQGDSWVGGLVGENYGRITNSYATGAVTGNGRVGGLVGDNRGRITNSYAAETVTGNRGVGGLVGENHGSVTNSYATGAVTGTGDNVGGLVGVNGGSVTNSYATGAVAGTGDNVGGLVGVNGDSVTNSYATGAVTGTGDNVGGLVGFNDFGGSVTNSYWNTQTSGLATSAGGDGVTSATTVQLQSPTAPGTTTTEVYYGWSRSDWDFGDNSHYPALRHARGDDLNACNPDITTPSAMPACALPLPNQRDRNQGLTALFVLADGDDVTAQLIPTFFPLKSSYDNIIVTTETAIQLTLRPYAVNNNATITITDQDNADYFAGKPNGASSDPIMLSDSITLTLVVTDTIDEATVNTTYTFIIRREDPLEILEITIESATNADGTINEASMASILFDVVGGVGSYRYEYKIIVGTEEILLSQSEPPVELAIPDNIVAIESTQQTIELNIIVRDSGGQTIEYRETLTIQKVDNGVAELDISRETSRTLIAMVGADPDGAIDDSAYQWQWRGPGAAAQWMDIESAASTSYTITDELAVVGNEFRIQVAYTDGQGYSYDALYSNTIRYDLLPRCTLAIADRDGDNVDSSIDIDKDGDGLIEICDLEGLNEIRYQLDGSGYKTSTDVALNTDGCPNNGCIGYELVKSLDFNVDANYRSASNKMIWAANADKKEDATNSGWLSIGETFASFRGIFEGNGYTISNLYTLQSSGLYLELHAGGEIKNVGLSDVHISDVHIRHIYDRPTGSLVGLNGGKIINSYVASGTVTGSNEVGGLVGRNAIKYLYSSDALIISTGTIVSSFAHADVSGDSQVGGLVGYNQGDIENTYSAGTVSGVNATSDLPVGGLVGENVGSITNSYTMSRVVSQINNASFAGGLIGSTTGTVAVVTASYWDTERSGIESSGGGSGKTTAELQTLIAPGMTATEVYYGWNTSDWDFGDSKHYPALRYAEGDNLNACLTEITPSSTALPCGILLPNQSGRNQGLAGIFFFADGKVAPTILTPLFSQLGYSYEMIIVSERNMQLRPYALNDNATIAINDHRDGNYFSDVNPNGALSDVIEWDGDATTLTVIVTDVVDGDPANTTYTFAVTRVVPLDIAEISVTPSGVVDEGSDMTITFTVSGGLGEYEYAYALDGEPLSSPSQPLLQFTIPTTLVASNRTTQTVEVNLIVRDDIQIIEHLLALIVRKVDNGDDFSISSEVSPSRLSAIFAGTDADGEGIVSYQWQQLALGGEWSNIAAATTPTYHLPANTDGSIRYRVNVQHTDGQGYVTHYQQGPFRTGDIDNDDDGLIEIYYLEDIAAMRYQLDGSGYKTSLSAPASMQGCPDLGCSGYELMRHLDFNNAADYSAISNRAVWTTGTSWQPIGTRIDPFSGLFEGNGYILSGLQINRSASEIGLFSVLHADGEIKNIGLLEVNVQGDDNVGSLVGENNGSIINSYATGTVSGAGTIGGLVGLSSNAIISSFANVAVNGNNVVGGLVGESVGSIANTYAAGTVAITVAEDQPLGGLVGRNEGSITNSYVISRVVPGIESAAALQTSGLVGVTTGSASVISASYWDSTVNASLTMSANAKTTAELQSPTEASGIYSDWSSADWDFGDNSHYPALRYARGDDLNACNPDITTPSAMLACAVPLPNQRDRNQGLTALFVLADGDDVTAELIPTFFPLKFSYDTLIVTTKTAVQLTLRPYAINDNATITITDQDNTSYFAGKPNGALSDPIMLSDELVTLTLVITDTINEAPMNTTYTFAIKRAIPLEVSAITLTPDATATIDEGDTITLTFDVSGGSDTYEYAYLLDGQPLPSPSQPPFEFTLATDIVDADATMQLVELTIRVRDDDGQTFEYSKDLTINKVNNGDPVITSEMSSKYLRIILGEPDVDGEGDFSLQWQSQVAAGDWMDIAGATTATYWLPASVDRNIRYRAVKISYTDGQGYFMNYADQGPFISEAMVMGDIDVEGPTNEGSTFTLSAPLVSGGSGEYRYEWMQTAEDSKQLSGHSALTLASTNTATVNAQIPADFIAMVATSANIIFKVIVSDGEFTTSRSTVVTINKIDNSSPAITAEVSSSRLRISLVTPDADGEGGFSLQWQSQVAAGDWMYIAGATTATYWLPASVDRNIRYRAVNIRYTDGQGYVMNYADQGPFLGEAIVMGGIDVEGPTNEGSTFTLSAPLVSGGSGEYRYEWMQTAEDSKQLSGHSALTLASTNTATVNAQIPADFIAMVATSANIIFKVIVSDGEFTTSRSTVVTINKIDNSSPAITAEVSSSRLRISLVTPDADGEGGFSLQWQSQVAAGDWMYIEGATTATYWLPAAAGRNIRYRAVKISYTDGQGYFMNYADQGPFISGAMVMGDIDVEGPTNEGSTFTLSAPLVSGGSGEYRYEWMQTAEDSKQLSGHSALTLASTNTATVNAQIPADFIAMVATSANIIFKVIVSDGEFTTSRSTVVTINKIDNSSPAITVEVSSSRLRISLVTPDADGEGDFSLQWQSQVAAGDWMDIAGATTATYWLPAAAGRNIRYRAVKISYTDGQGYVMNYADQGPFISGAMVMGDIDVEGPTSEGSTFTLSVSSVSGGSGEYRYEWMQTAEDSKQLSGHSALTLASTNTATVNAQIPADFIAMAATSANIIFKVVVSDGFTMTSRSKVVTIHKINNGPADITITETTGTLSITVNDPDGNVTDPTYQWQRFSPESDPPWMDINTATEATYVPDDTPIATRFRVLVTYTDGQGYKETVESAEIVYPSLVKGIKVRIKVFLEGPLR